MPKKKPSGSGNPARTKAVGGLGLLLTLAGVAVTAAYASVLAVKLSNAPVLPWTHLAPLAAYLLALLVTRGTLAAVGYRGDPALVAATFLLAGIGLTVQFRVGVYAGGLPALFPFALGVGSFLLVVVLTGKGRVQSLARLGGVAYLAALAVLAAMLVLGERFRGGLFLPGNYNPSEAVKPLLAVFVAAFLSRRATTAAAGRAAVPPRDLLLLAGLWAIPAGITVLLGDLGLCLLLNGMLVCMLYASSRRVWWLAAGVAALVALGAAGGALSAHAQARVMIWRDPFLDPTGKGWQVLQSLAAMYSGGLWGSGLGTGVPGAVPIVVSDFIYAGLAEEIGWAGCALLLALFGVLCGRGWRAAANAATPFAVLVAAGVASCFAVQALLNVAGVTKALPLTGITLPFISHGGSSLVISFVAAGLLAAVSERT